MAALLACSVAPRPCAAPSFYANFIQLQTDQVTALSASSVIPCSESMAEITATSALLMVRPVQPPAPWQRELTWQPRCLTTMPLSCVCARVPPPAAGGQNTHATGMVCTIECNTGTPGAPAIPVPKDGQLITLVNKVTPSI